MLIPDIFYGMPVKCCFTTKAYGSNVDAISKAFNISSDRVYLPVQRHTDKVLILDYELEPRIADAVVTNNKGVLIGIQTADCVPILLYDKRNHAVGAVHAGWRGTAGAILKKTIIAMVDRFCSSMSDILIAVGPSIRWCCYGVGYEVIEAVQKATGKGDYYINKADKYYIDLAVANKHQAVSIGVPEYNIWIANDCTFCHPEKYYSYRFTKGTTGRQGGFIGIV